MKEFVKIDLTKEILNAFASCGVYWMKEHCLEAEYTNTCVECGAHNLYFKFGENTSETEFHTQMFNLTREDAKKFLVCYLDTKWGIDADYHIDALWFASDGDEDDCQYVIKAEVFKEN